MWVPPTDKPLVPSETADIQVLTLGNHLCKQAHWLQQDVEYRRTTNTTNAIFSTVVVWQP